MLKHCGLQDLTVLRAIICSLEQINKFCEMLLVTTVQGEQRTVVGIKVVIPQRVKDLKISSYFLFFLLQPNLLVHIAAFVVRKDM